MRQRIAELLTAARNGEPRKRGRPRIHPIQSYRPPKFARRTYPELTGAEGNEILARGVDANEVGPSVKLRKLGFDSLEMSQLCLELEHEFGISIPDEDMQKIFTVEDIVNYADPRSH